MQRIVLATGNSGKVTEMQSLIAGFGYEVVPQSHFQISEAVEDGLSFVENAIIKARHACAQTGLTAIADDSGLEVDALSGRPGIHSARYAAGLELDCSRDSANNKKLLAELDNKEDRTARYHCIVVMMGHENDPTPIVCQGTWEGKIATEHRGEHGFGYDPIFYCPRLGCHAAELPPEVKKKVSHRAIALKQLEMYLTESKNTLE